MDRFDLGYAMGLLACAGSFTGDRQQPSVEVKVHRRDYDALEHLRHTLGGRIFGPYTHGGRNACAYMLRGRALRAALPLIEQHLPAGWKRVQFEEWRTRYAGFFDRPEPSADLLARLRQRLTLGHN